MNRSPWPVSPILRRSGPILWARCWNGLEPAEALDVRDREDLVAELLALGWSLVQIAAWTRMSTYTTWRIATRVHDQAADTARRDAA